MKHLLLIACSLFLSLQVLATAQVPDILIWKGDTMPLHANPLESHPAFEQLSKNLYGAKDGCMNTACWRGYQAEWTLEKDQLYLTAIYSCCYQDDSVKADLRTLFPKQLSGGRVKADWVTDTLWAQQGELLHYVHLAYESTYEKETRLTILEGKLTGVEEFSNAKTILSTYTSDKEVFSKFFYSNVDWESLPALGDTSVFIAVSFVPNEAGKIDSIKVLRGKEEFIQEAERVFRLIPAWTIYYKHGKPVKTRWSSSVTFSEENRKKYAR